MTIFSSHKGEGMMGGGDGGAGLRTQLLGRRALNGDAREWQWQEKMQLR